VKEYTTKAERICNLSAFFIYSLWGDILRARLCIQLIKNALTDVEGLVLFS